MDGLIFLRAQWDRVAAWVLIGLGAVLVLVGGAQARQATDLGDELAFMLSGGFAGLVAGVAGGALLVSAGLHDEWRLVARIETGRVGGPDKPASPPHGRRRLGGWAWAEWDRALGWVLCGGAAVLLAATYPALADSPWGAAEVAYVVSGGVGALLAVVVGAGLLLGADLRDTAHKLDLLDGTEQVGPLRHWQLLIGGPVLCGAVLVAAGWWVAADTLQVSVAMGGLVVASVGLLVAAGAVAVGGLAMRRSVARRLVALERPVEMAVEAAAVPAPAEVGGFWTADGLRRFHRSTCPALPPAAMSQRRPVPSSTGLEPCRICKAGE